MKALKMMSFYFNHNEEVGEMDKKRILTQEDAAKNLLVLLDGEQWLGKSIAIVNRGMCQEYWVRTIISDMQGKRQQDYVVEYTSLVTAWFGLKCNKKVFEQLRIEMNDVMWKAVNLTTFQDNQGRDWIQLDIKNMDKEQHSIAIEKDSMIDAFMALKDDIEDLALILKGVMKALANNF